MEDAIKALLPKQSTKDDHDCDPECCCFVRNRVLSEVYALVPQIIEVVHKEASKKWADDECNEELAALIK